MVLLHQTVFDKLEKIRHYKSSHNPPYFYSPRASCSQHGWTQVLDSTSNRERDIINLHTSHLKDIYPYRIEVPFSLSSTKYPY